MEHKYKAYITLAHFHKEINSEFPNVSPIIKIFSDNRIYTHKLLKKIERYEGAIPVYDLNATIIADLPFLIEDFDLKTSEIFKIIEVLEQTAVLDKKRKYFDYELLSLFIHTLNHLKSRYILDN